MGDMIIVIGSINIYMKRKSTEKGRNYVIFSGRNGSYGTCSVKVYFNESNTVSKYSYKYTFKHSSNKVRSTACIRYETDMQLWYSNSYQDIGLGSSLLTKQASRRLRNTNYASGSKTYTISFSENEQLILEQSGNLEKLKKVLRDSKLY